MEMLRSPKHLTGPDLGIPSLTFRAWYEARFGADGWQALHKVWRLDWRDYLLWVRRQVGVTVDNGVALRDVAPARDAVRVTLSGQQGEQVLHVRKLVLALGREGSGAPRLPSFASLDSSTANARARVFHSADSVPFHTFGGRRIGVLGVGASAFDNAAMALEQGAGSVVMFARRAQLPQVNKSKWTSFPGFFRGYPALPDAERARFYAHIFDEAVPPPFESVLRCDRHAGFSLHLAEPWLDVAPDADGVTVTTPLANHRFDAVILGTGFDVNLIDRPELQAFVPWVMTWADRQVIQPSPSADEIGRFPYLGESFQLMPRTGTPTDLAHAMSRIHLFNWGAAISHGAVAGDIPGLALGANRIASALVRDLFVEDADRHYPRMVAHEEPELKPTRWWSGLSRG
jgi:cation diffusion facilitator CzcD-associated flavoprotein CzcO